MEYVLNYLVKNGKMSSTVAGDVLYSLIVEHPVANGNTSLPRPPPVVSAVFPLRFTPIGLLIHLATKL